MDELTLLPTHEIARRIQTIRNQRVMLDSDLAHVYGVTTKALNQAVKRNPSRFPTDFVFALTASKKQEVKFSQTLPFTFNHATQQQLKQVFDALRDLMTPVIPAKNPSGFIHTK